MNKVTRGEKILQNLVDQGQISASGRDWLIAAIDPFHDKQLANLQGWPDLESGNSVVRCVKQSITIKKPDSVPDGNGTYDAHIILWPFLSAPSVNTSEATQRLGQTFSFTSGAGVISSPVGGLQVFGMPSGQNLNILQTGDVRQLGRIDLPAAYTKGAGRVVGVGFEAHNTTAQLQIQGAVAVYRQNQLSVSPSLFLGCSEIAADTQTSYGFSGVPLRYPPLNTEEALLLPGSRQWDAKEGCYCVAAFNDAENPAKPIQPILPVILASGVDELEGVGATSLINFVRPIPGTLTLNPNMSAAVSMRVHPLHQSGAIFTGLSNQSTLTINMNVFYESFPGLAEQEILPLARPSCEFDPDALDLFERILQQLPVGVQVKENGLGDWFLGAVRDAAPYLGKVLSMIPHPIAQGAGALINYAGDTAGKYMKTYAPPNDWETSSGFKYDETAKKNYKKKQKPAAKPASVTRPKKTSKAPK